MKHRELGIVVTIGYQCNLIEFVEKINRREGVCSLHDIFVELITIHTNCFNEYSYSDKKTIDQIKLMWKDIQESYPEMKHFVSNYKGDTNEGKRGTDEQRKHRSEMMKERHRLRKLKEIQEKGQLSH